MTRFYFLIIFSSLLLPHSHATVTVIDALGGIQLGGGFSPEMPPQMSAPSMPAHHSHRGPDTMPSAQIYIKGQSCPFLSKDQDVATLWQSTKDVLSDIARRKESDGCALVMSNAAVLQKALDNLETEKFRSVDGGSSSYSASSYYVDPTMGYSSTNTSGPVTPNCDNYETVYQYEYEELLKLSSRNYQITSMPTDYEQCASLANPFNPNQIYADGFSNCIADVFSKKLQKGHIKCEGQAKYINKLDRQKNAFAAQKDALTKINSAITGLSKHLSDCSNQELVKSSIQSVISIGSMMASPAIGGVGGVASALSADVLNNIINMMYSGGVKKDLAEMDKEDAYNRNACLFLQSQQLRCMDGKPVQLSLNECEQQELKPLGNETLIILNNLKRTISFSSENQKLKNLTDYLKEKKDSKSPIDRLENEVLPEMRKSGLFKEMAIVEDFLKGINLASNLQNQLQSGQLNPSSLIPPLEIKTSRNPASEQIPAYEALEKLEAQILSLDIQGALNGLIQTQGKNDPLGAASYHEVVRQITQQYNELNQSTINNWSNLRTVDMATTALVNNLKEQFIERLGVHFKSDLKTAIAFEKENKEKAFDSLSGIINDCLYTEGIHAMDKSRSETDARSTALISKSDHYQKLCEKFKCPSGIPAYDYNNSSPESFRKHQCSSNFNGLQIIERLKKNFLKDGKICGSSLNEILSSNKKF